LSDVNFTRGCAFLRIPHQVEDPTVINPEKYKVRFRKAMDRYFMVAPDRNAHLPEIEQNDQGPGVND
jgi:hypothetical protein